MVVERTGGEPKMFLKTQNLLQIELGQPDETLGSNEAVNDIYDELQKMQKSSERLSSDKLFFLGSGEKLFIFPERATMEVFRTLNENGTSFDSLEACGLVFTIQNDPEKTVRLNWTAEIKSRAGFKYGGEVAKSWLESMQDKLPDNFSF